jgi:lipase chaperone LimK
MDIRSSVEQINTTLQDVRAARVAIENDPSLTPDEKRQQVNELQATVEQFLKEAGIRQLRSESE